MAETPDFAGIVLAGGASSRMGEDKALLQTGDVSLLQHTVERLRAAGAAPVIVSGERPGFDYVPDQTPGLGPLGGIASVLAARPQRHGQVVLILPVDTPGLDPAALRRLAGAAREHGGAVYAHHPLPLAVQVNAALRRTLRTLLEGDGRASVKRLGQRLNVHILPGHGVDLRNLNTPDEWQQFREQPA